MARCFPAPGPSASLSRRLVVGRSGETGIASDRPPVTQVAREHLLHQHVGGFDADVDNSCQQLRHRVRPVARRLVRRIAANIAKLPEMLTRKD